MSRILKIALFIVAAGSPFLSALGQQIEPGIWFGMSPAATGISEVERFELQLQPTGVAIRWAPFGKAPGNWGVISLRPDSSIEFQWAATPLRVCTLRPIDTRNYEGTCRSSDQLERGLTLTRNAQPNGLALPISDADFQILARARTILSGPGVWNRKDDRACEDDATQHSWSLFCALYQASMDLAGQFLGSRPVWGATRGAVGEKRNDRAFQHLLMDYNNLESTTYRDIAAAFDRAEARLHTRKACTDHGSDWSALERDLPAIEKSNRAVEEGMAYWNEPIAYSVHGQVYRLSAMVGPLTSTGRIPTDWLDESAAVTRRTWKWRDFVGVDARGQLRNGNRWRYFAMCGDILAYYDAHPTAAAYFDRIVDDAWAVSPNRQRPPHE